LECSRALAILPHDACDDTRHPSSDAFVLDLAGPVALAGPDVDQGVELQPVVIAVLLGVEVYAPDVGLPGAVIEKGGLAVRMQVSADGHDLSFDVNCRLDHVAET